MEAMKTNNKKNNKQEKKTHKSDYQVVLSYEISEILRCTIQKKTEKTQQFKKQDKRNIIQRTKQSKSWVFFRYYNYI